MRPSELTSILPRYSPLGCTTPSRRHPNSRRGTAGSSAGLRLSSSGFAVSCLYQDPLPPSSLQSTVPKAPLVTSSTTSLLYHLSTLSPHVILLENLKYIWMVLTRPSPEILLFGFHQLSNFPTHKQVRWPTSANAPQTPQQQERM